MHPRRQNNAKKWLQRYRRWLQEAENNYKCIIKTTTNQKRMRGNWQGGKTTTKRSTLSILLSALSIYMCVLFRSFLCFCSVMSVASSEAPGRRTISQQVPDSACADWSARAKARLVSQTLNGALALIVAANLWPLLVISDAATDTYHRPAQIHRLGWTVAERGRKPGGSTAGTEPRISVCFAV